MVSETVVEGRQATVSAAKVAKATALDSRVAAGSAIGGNDKIDASRHRHLVDMIGFETVAFLYAMGDVIGHIRSGFQ